MFMPNPTPNPSILIQEILKNLPLIIKAISAFVDALKTPKVDDAEKLEQKQFKLRKITLLQKTMMNIMIITMPWIRLLLMRKNQNY